MNIEKLISSNLDDANKKFNEAVSDYEQTGLSSAYDRAKICQGEILAYHDLLCQIQGDRTQRKTKKKGISK